MHRSREPARSRTLAVGVLAATFVVYALTTSLAYLHIDVHAAALASWRIATTGAPWMEGVDVAETGVPRDKLFIGEAANGHVVIHRSPGVVAAAVPAYWIAGGDTAPEAFSRLPSAITAAALTAGAVMLYFLCLVRRLPTREALLSSGVLALATPMWTVAGNSLWTHSITTLALLGMAWASATGRWWLVGVFGGIGLWGRLHVAVIVAILGLGLALSRRSPRIAFVIGAASLPWLALASVWSRWMYGTWGPSGGYSSSGYLSNLRSGAETDVWGQVTNHLGLYVSPDRGILVWTPVLVLLLPAVVRSWRHLPDWSRWLAYAGVAYALVQGQLNMFMGGSGYYGYRLTLELLVCVAPAYALSVRHAGTWARRLLGPTLGLQLAAMTVGAISEGFYVFLQHAWVDNSLWLAVRTEPLVGVWVLLMVLVGHLAGRTWQDRRVEGSGASS